MNYPQTIDIFWGRLKGGLDSSDYSKWAMGLMVKGMENDDINHLASNEDLHWQEIEKYFERILQNINEYCPTDVYELCKAIERKLVIKYSSGEILGTELVAECYQLWVKSNYDSYFRIWQDIDEDIYMCTTDHGTIFYEIDKSNIEKSIKNILLKENKVAQQGDRPEPVSNHNQ
jgi:hypothetical protein